MSDSDTGTSTGSTPYESSEDDMICYITGTAQSVPKVPDLQDAAQLSEENWHSRQLQTKSWTRTSVATADSRLGIDTNSHSGMTMFSSGDAREQSSIATVDSGLGIDTNRHSRMSRFSTGEARKRSSIATTDSGLGIDTNSQLRMTRFSSGDAREGSSIATTDSAHGSDTSRLSSGRTSTAGREERDFRIDTRIQQLVTKQISDRKAGNQAPIPSADRATNIQRRLTSFLDREARDCASVVSADSGLGNETRSIWNDLDSDSSRLQVKIKKIVREEWSQTSVTSSNSDVGNDTSSLLGDHDSDTSKLQSVSTSITGREAKDQVSITSLRFKEKDKREALNKHLPIHIDNDMPREVGTRCGQEKEPRRTIKERFNAQVANAVSALGNIGGGVLVHVEAPSQTLARIFWA
ncbi:suppressor protein SRP40-like [Haliotis rufescens]|uniref:suppressor protein SRP40-like n=1 Tax=Haliotis rufescens TaxID=6454 RepID=UPI00201F9DEE|nr:suppressor protein SRP40-like [Haliotis rufescens]